ncbi:MAG: heme NO-binding domain-containing protein [Bacteroidia bacterium]
MYGLVNDAIKGLVIANYGETAWLQVRSRSGIDVDHFMSHESYPDSMTYELAQAADELGVPLGTVLQAFGEYWVLVTARQKYGAMLSTAGRSLKDFLINLPSFHIRVMLLFPNLQPPEFQTSDIGERSLHLHYYSDRHGLQDFVLGLIRGLGKMYDTPVAISLLASRDQGADHEVFRVEW